MRISASPWWRRKQWVSEYQRCVEENEMLRSRYDELVYRCEKLGEECVLYDQDREALMEFGNGSQARAAMAGRRPANWCCWSCTSGSVRVSRRGKPKLVKKSAHSVIKLDRKH